MKLLFSLTAAILIASSLEARIVKVPEKEPAFSFNLPEGWTLTSAPGGDVACTPGDGSNFSFFFAGYKNSLMDEAELKSLLDGQAKLAAGPGKEEKTDVRIDPMRERETNNKVRIFSITRHVASPDGGNRVEVYAGFVLRAGRYFLLGSGGSAEAHNAHEKAMNEILDSIKPVEAEDES